MNKILDKYYALCESPSDINEHLHKLREYAEKVSRVTEMGVRGVVSTYAFLAGKPKKLTSYDIGRWPQMDECEQLAAGSGTDFSFIQKSVLEVRIEQTDLLFIDTYHTAGQLAKELELHAGMVTRFIAFHDTTTFWEKGEDPYEGLDDKGRSDGRGLRYAIEPFLEAHPEWKEVYRTEKNNGLMIIERNA